ncbi:MAG: FliI/YscN family ATPase [Candidatus Cloacimonadota bacterium]|nr:FliI/YscN family ATPase [Candidatus Cloacimonadota bacterium]
MNSLISTIFMDPIRVIENTSLISQKGKIENVYGMTVESRGPNVKIGEICRIISGKKSYLAEVVGFKDNLNQLMCFNDFSGISPGCEVISERANFNIPFSDQFVGRVINGIGQPIDDKGGLIAEEFLPIGTDPINPMKRVRVDEPLCTGIKAIDATATIGKGQRVGIFSGTGVGKSVLLGMIAKSSTADINVIGLIGERGREVKEFVENILGPEGLKRSIVVAVTSDESPLMRVKGAFLITAIAEYFRGRGNDVMLLMDSITRFARALREIGLAVGEPPTVKGYPPSIFSILPKILERPGKTEDGSITGIYTVLVEEDDLNNPIEDEVRAILDGHIILDRNLANINHYPAIDILGSISRVMRGIISEEHKELYEKIIETYSIYKETEDLITLGAYAKGTNKKIDYAIENIDRINHFFKQDISESFSLEETIDKLKKVLK